MTSVIILNFNTFSGTSVCIESVLNAGRGEEVEVILVDNGSQECPPARFLERFPGIRLIATATNLGFSGGVNLALPHCRGDFVLLLNSDAVLSSDVLQRCRAYMMGNPGVGALTTRVITPDGRAQAVINRFPSLRRELLELIRAHRVFGMRRAMLGEFWDYHSPVEGDWIWGAFFFVRRSLLGEFPGGRFPDDYFMYFEDVQWGFAMRELGVKVAFAPLGDVVHLCSGSSPGMTEGRKLDLITANEKHFFVNRYGRAYLAALYLLRAFKYLSIGDIQSAGYFVNRALN